MRRVCGALLAVTALGGLVGGPPEVEAQQPLKIRLGVHTALMGVPDVLGIREGYFRREGLEVDWRRFALGKEGRDAMIAGAIDVNATATTPFMIGLDKGVPYTAVAVNSLFCGSNHIVVLKGSDINSVLQLRGKKIALARGTITDYVFTARIAPANGLKPGEYELVNIPEAKDRIPSMVAKAIDAAGVTDPFFAVAEHEGLVRSLGDLCRYDPLPFMLTVTNRTLRENSEAVVAYLRGWLRAIKLLKEQPEKAAGVYWQEQKEMGRDVPQAVLDRALRRMRWEPEITAEIERYLNDQARDMTTEVGGRRLKAVPDIPRALNRELLQRAKAGL